MTSGKTESLISAARWTKSIRIFSREWRRFCVTKKGLVIKNKLGLEKLMKADTIVLAGEPVADTRLYEQIKDKVPEAYSIGDCNGLGLIAGATKDAMEVATKI